MSLHIQLYDRRRRHLKEKERDKWAQIDYRYMTEESELDSDTVLQHPLPWRSDGELLTSTPGGMRFWYSCCVCVCVSVTALAGATGA